MSNDTGQLLFTIIAVKFAKKEDDYFLVTLFFALIPIEIIRKKGLLS